MAKGIEKKMKGDQEDTAASGKIEEAK